MIIYGADWLFKQYELCMEAKHTDLMLDAALFPLARTPMDKKSGRSLNNYSKDLGKMLERSLLPWKQNPAYRELQRLKSKRGIKATKKKKKIPYKNAHRGVKPGEVKVFGTGAELSHPLFKDVDVAKD